MVRFLKWWNCLPLLGVALVGCQRADTPIKSKLSDEADVRQAFQDLQKALEANDPDKLWPLFSKEFQAAREQEAKRFRSDFEKATPKEQENQVQALGLPADTLRSITGKDLLGAKPFREEYDEVHDADIESVTIEGDRATVNYVENDKDKDKRRLEFKREDNKWKAALLVP